MRFKYEQLINNLKIAYFLYKNDYDTTIFLVFYVTCFACNKTKKIYIFFNFNNLSCNLFIFVQFNTFVIWNKQWLFEYVL